MKNFAKKEKLKMKMKCVVIVDPELPIGLVANTASILGCSLGKAHPEINGEDTYDKNDQLYPGIVNIPIPILKADSNKINEIHRQANQYEEIEVISFVDVAQQVNNYEEYKAKLKQSTDEDLNFLGICLYGSEKKVNHFSGSLPMLR
ncbi:DUF2000 domain-containing protein [Leuconostoc sp. DB-1]|uniref:DUF2000 domain-containing protein n=1 Tax=Leuconostoc sp. DB-1 TaxID=2724526 RepID=UPI00211DA5B1|nr:DUF2000 domain-containing protein [Leuconostoc sp. DB-1]